MIYHLIANQKSLESAHGIPTSALGSPNVLRCFRMPECKTIASTLLLAVCRHSTRYDEQKLKLSTVLAVRSVSGCLEMSYDVLGHHRMS